MRSCVPTPIGPLRPIHLAADHPPELIIATSTRWFSFVEQPRCFDRDYSADAVPGQSVGAGRLCFWSGPLEPDCLTPACVVLCHTGPAK